MPSLLRGVVLGLLVVGGGATGCGRGERGATLARGAPPEGQDTAATSSQHHQSTASERESAPHSRPDTLLVYLAASLTRPFQPALDSFAARTGAVIQRESGGSLDHARKITELHRIPDLLALADAEVFPELLMPAYVTWYADFARDRMVVAYTDRSRGAAALDSASWTGVLTRPDVQVGRADPAVAPVGYRTLVMMQLAERYYRRPGLAARLLANAPRRNMRPTASELAALLSIGELDYIYDYESVARAYGFRWLRLPTAIDLSDPARAAEYARVSVSRRPRDSGAPAAAGDSAFVGHPIVFALSVPDAAPHHDAGIRLAAFVLSPEGRRLIGSTHLDVLPAALLVGAQAPTPVRDAVAR